MNNLGSIYDFIKIYFDWFFSLFGAPLSQKWSFFWLLNSSIAWICSSICNQRAKKDNANSTYICQNSFDRILVVITKMIHCKFYWVLVNYNLLMSLCAKSWLNNLSNILTKQPTTIFLSFHLYMMHKLMQKWGNRRKHEEASMLIWY